MYTIPPPASCAASIAALIVRRIVDSRIGYGAEVADIENIGSARLAGRKKRSGGLIVVNGPIRNSIGHEMRPCLLDRHAALPSANDRSIMQVGELRTSFWNK